VKIETTSPTKFCNLTVKKGSDGSKHLDIQLHGVIDGGWGDDAIATAPIVQSLQDHFDAKTVSCRINSVGGSAFGGVAMYAALQTHPGEVTCIVEGLAASAASLVAMAGKTVMGRGAMMMIHPPSSGLYGNATELRKLADTLDKVQDALASIYTEKTGKSLEAINSMIDEETWMTAEEAVAKGFADEVANYAAGGDAEPDPNDPNEGNENEPPEDRGEVIVFNRVSFPRSSMPAQIVAMAKKPAPPVPVAEAAPVLALVPPLLPPAPITRAELEQREPALLASILEEGRAAGVAAERARLAAIDELPVMGCADLVQAAKYGAKPTDAPTLAVEIVKAQKGAGAELLARRQIESRPIAAVSPGVVENSDQAARARVIKAIADGGNARRGGNGS
jgi:ATP-dependent Clp endopeptidase proteolytic subunit ClpP